MRRIRELQDEMHGFRAFISWTFQSDGNRLADKVAPESMPTSFDYLLTQAVSRIYLDNVDHIQSSWVTQGMKIGQVALDFGADDMGSMMIEENVVSAAGTTYRATTEDFVRAIRAIGKVPRAARHAVPRRPRLELELGRSTRDGSGHIAYPQRSHGVMGAADRTGTRRCARLRRELGCGRGRSAAADDRLGSPRLRLLDERDLHVLRHPARRHLRVQPQRGAVRGVHVADGVHGPRRSAPTRSRCARPTALIRAPRRLARGRWTRSPRRSPRSPRARPARLPRGARASRSPTTRAERPSSAVSTADFLRPASSPRVFTGLAQGPHTFRVRALDAAGNASGAASRAWKVDTIAPRTTIVTGPKLRTASHTARFTFRSSEAGSRFQCKLDRRAWQACKSPRTYRNLGRGDHVLRVRAKDAAGNVDRTPAKRSWRVV